MLDGGPLIVLILGLATGVYFHLRWRRFWVASVVAAAVGSVLWVGGCYVLFAFTDPDDLGPPLLVPVLLTMATALTGAIVAGCCVRGVGRGWRMAHNR